MELSNCHVQQESKMFCLLFSHVSFRFSPFHATAINNSAHDNRLIECSAVGWTTNAIHHHYLRLLIIRIFIYNLSAFTHFLFHLCYERSQWESVFVTRQKLKNERDYRIHSKRIDLRLFAQYEWAMWMANVCVCVWVRDKMKCARTVKIKSAPATSARIYSWISRWEMNFNLQRNQPFLSNYIFFYCFSLTNWFIQWLLACVSWTELGFLFRHRAIFYVFFYSFNWLNQFTGYGQIKVI